MENEDLKLHGLEFSLAIGCKLNCKYCPQEKLIKRYVCDFGKDVMYMKFEDFKTCLSKVNKGGGISFAGMVEPFHNRECARMIKYAYDLGYKITLATTLVGMTDDDFEMIKDVKFHDLLIHIPDKEYNSKFIITDEYIKMFKKVSKKFNTISYSCHGEIHKKIKDFIDETKPFNNIMMNRAGNLEYDELKTYNHIGKIKCGCGTIVVESGWCPTVLPNGTMVLCCMDYGMKHILGNLIKDKVFDIINGDEYKKIEKGLDDDSIDILCRKCSMAVKDDEYLNLLASNAIKVSRLVNTFSKTKEFIYDIDDESKELVKRLASSKEIIIFGAGKLFDDNYVNSCWNFVFKSRYICDNNEEKWGKVINDLKCISPNELLDIYDENTLVVTYVKNDYDIIKQLKNMGINNIVNIYSIFNIFN